MYSRISTLAVSPEPPAARLPYLPGLDGLRALAVIAVLLYHANLPVWGGFLGVEAFFVLSGFLITALLVVEWRHYGRIDFKAFWLRRARRILPALFLVLIGTLTFVMLVLPTEVAALSKDTLAALGYVMNWHLMASQQSYFDPVARPPLLQHLWSLAVEEQFYLIWPVVFLLGVGVFRRTGFWIATLVAAAASSLLMLALYEPGADTTRLYYGTDTRATGLLLGAALAMVWTPGQIPQADNRRISLLLDSAGLLALGGMLASFIWVPDYTPLLYQGGLTLFSIGTVIVIAAVAHPHTRLLPTLLGWQPLRWIGLRSYGIYLWHWPVFMLTRPHLDIPLDGWQLLALRFTIVFVLAALSYRLVEMPIRHGALGQLWQRLRGRLATSRPTHAPAPTLEQRLTSEPVPLSAPTHQRRKTKKQHRAPSRRVHQPQRVATTQR